MAWDFVKRERITGIAHTTVMNWVRESGEELSEDEPENQSLLPHGVTSTLNPCLKKG